MLMGILNILRRPEGKKPLNLNLAYPKDHSVPFFLCRHGTHFDLIYHRLEKSEVRFSIFMFFNQKRVSSA